MNVLSVTVQNRVVSEFYGPVVNVEYEEGIFFKSTCRREVHKCLRTNRWVFVADNSPVAPDLQSQITAAYNNVVEVRRSSRPPPRNPSIPPVQTVHVYMKEK